MLTIEDIKGGKPFEIVPKIDVPDLGRGVLSVDRFGEFVKAVRDSAVIIPEARIDNALKSYEKDISRLSLVLDVGPGRDATGQKLAPPESTAEVKTNTLYMREMVTKVIIHDDAIEDNIEGKAFEQKIVTLLGEGISYVLEKYYLHGDTSSSDPLLKMSDGWLKLAGEKLTESDVDPAAEDWPMNLFDTMIESLPTPYRNNLPNMKFYVTWDIYRAYRDALKGRETGLGDQALTGANSVLYNGRPVQYVPALEALNDGKSRALFVVPTQLVYGFWRNIKVVPDYDAEMRLTKYVASLRTDNHYEDEEGAVSATITV